MPEELENGSAEVVTEPTKEEEVQVEESKTEESEVKEESAEDKTEEESTEEEIVEESEEESDDEKKEPEEEEKEPKEAEEGKEGDKEEGEESDKEKEGDDAKEESEEEAEEDSEPIVFAEDDELPAIVEKVEQLSDKYDMPEEVANAISALQVKAESNTIAEFADYGDKEQITATLETQNNLTSSRIEDGNLRPNTDVFVKDIAEGHPEGTTDYLMFDLHSQPSRKYPNLTRLQEINADALAMEGDTIGDVMKRHDQWQAAVTTGAQVPTDMIPAWVTPDLYGTFQRLDKVTRDELIESAFDPEYEDDQLTITAKLGELRSIDKGRQAELKEITDKREAKETEDQKLRDEVIDTEDKFFATTRVQTAERLEKENGMSKGDAAALVTLCEAAFDEGGYGEFARAALKSDDIKFDGVKAQSILQNIRIASAKFVDAKQHKTTDGKPINQAEYNKAVNQVKTTGVEWQKFIDDVIDQQNGKQSEQKTLRAKAKITRKKKAAPKPRAAVQTSASETGKKTKAPVFSRERYLQDAEDTMREMEKTQSYR